MAAKRKTELDIDPSVELPIPEAVEEPKKGEAAVRPPPAEPVVTAEAAPKPGKKKGSKRTIYIVAGALSAAVLAGGVTLAVFFAADKKPTPVVKIEKAVVKKPAPKLVNNMDLDPFILPVDRMDGKNFLRIKFSLSLSSEGAVAEVKENLPSMREAIYRFTKQHEIDEFMSPDMKNITMLELRRVLDRKLQNGRVQEVYITEVTVF